MGGGGVLNLSGTPIHRKGPLTLPEGVDGVGRSGGASIPLPLQCQTMTATLLLSMELAPKHPLMSVYIWDTKSGTGFLCSWTLDSWTSTGTYRATVATDLLHGSDKCRGQRGEKNNDRSDGQRGCLIMSNSRN